MFVADSIYNEGGVVSSMAGQMQMFQGINLYVFSMILLACILVVIYVAVFQLYFNFSKRTLSFKSKSGKNKIKNKLDMNLLYKTIEKAGYSYDQCQDIFYSNLDAWQRERGYCRLYDEGAAPFGMIIDCEPIYFEYDGKRWLIEFWKGQYDLTTGGELGVYCTDKEDLDIHNVFKGTFYNCVSDEELLDMAFVLKKNGKVLFTREAKHWWITGFKLGEFSNPSELTMYIKITLKDKKMRDAFIKGLKEAGYSEDKLIIDENTVCVRFDKPYTTQPLTRAGGIDWLVQKKNKVLCDMYNEITEPYNNFPDKANAVYQQSPELFDAILNIGKNKEMFEKYKKIKNYLE